ncbi:c-type cytochrome biogenesis protein CcmI [Marivita hallyeonensis]|uniref:Cytochrome c-type biogenesis protein CcmH n=1 Tax=Marivita hallyeonensis TaxID=996342 RepID=A0A1M5S2H2_9RHOB|nr:c-type cytochrome biogenesis protein CcmI [Marivita hallyeonensis]SHH32508.1 cytochrome c-type biogenesis protein CcmH [Marivita hallyeonensis]
MTFFWIATVGLAVAMAGLLVLALLRGQRNTGPAEAFDVQVYRDQLTEVDRDLARGVISDEDAERLRTEISRRILSADAKVQATGAGGDQPKTLGGAVAMLVAALVVGGSFWLYGQLGAPGYGDLGLSSRMEMAQLARENRPLQEEAEAQIPEVANPDVQPEYGDLVQRLRGAVAERPNDLQGHILLARSEAAMGNYVAAYEAQERVLSIKGDSSTASDYADLADMMVLAAGGYVSPEAERVLEAALARDPQNGVARYYMGLMMAQTGRPDIAFRLWDQLVRQSPADAAWMPPILAQIEDMAFRAGVSDYQVPRAAALPGPTADDVEAAGEMTPEERQEMIRGMVAQLSDRLATEGGPPEDWARLITSLAVLGDQGQAIAVWNNAQEVFAENPDALEIVREGARAAGLVL